MPRKGPAPKRQILPDPKFNSKVLARFINKVMLCGKKIDRRAHQLRCARDRLRKDRSRPDGNLFAGAVQRDAPGGSASRRVGGATYQVPMEVRPDRRQAMAMRWLIALRAPATGARWKRSSRASCSTHPITPVPRSRSVKTRTRWLKPTKLSPIIVGSTILDKRPWLQGNIRSNARGISALPRTSMPAKQPHRTHPFLHRTRAQDGRSARRRRDDGLDGSGAGARHHDYFGRNGRRGATRASTSSTRPGTSTSPLKSNGRCASSTAW